MVSEEANREEFAMNLLRHVFYEVRLKQKQDLITLVEAHLAENSSGDDSTKSVRQLATKLTVGEVSYWDLLAGALLMSGAAPELSLDQNKVDGHLAHIYKSWHDWLHTGAVFELKVAMADKIMSCKGIRGNSTQGTSTQETSAEGSELCVVAVKFMKRLLQNQIKLSAWVKEVAVSREMRRNMQMNL